MMTERAVVTCLRKRKMAKMTVMVAMAQDFNNAGHAKSYLNKEWRGPDGKLLRSTKPGSANASTFYELVGSTPFGNDYELQFARELVTSEKLGTGAATDLLIVSLSANDILGHYAGPDSPEVQAMAVATDRQSR